MTHTFLIECVGDAIDVRMVNSAGYIYGRTCLTPSAAEELIADLVAAIREIRAKDFSGIEHRSYADDGERRSLCTQCFRPFAHNVAGLLVCRACPR